MNTFRDEVEGLVETVEAAKKVSPDLSHFAMQLRTHIEKDKMPLHATTSPEHFQKDMEVVIVSGPFGGNKGIFIKLVNSAIPSKDAMALIDLYAGGRMPVTVKVADIKENT